MSNTVSKHTVISISTHQ